MGTLTYINKLRTKAEQWQQYFPWHIAFWGMFADVMPRLASKGGCYVENKAIAMGFDQLVNEHNGPAPTR